MYVVYTYNIYDVLCHMYFITCCALHMRDRKSVLLKLDSPDVSKLNHLACVLLQVHSLVAYLEDSIYDCTL